VTWQAFIISAAGASDAAADADGAADAAALLAGASLDDSDELLELQPARANAETAMTAAAILRLVFNVSPY
jgi:hypothetical protein